MQDLISRLEDYNNEGIYPMHMPGHKRNSGLSDSIPWHLDITEIEGFDNLHNPHDLITHCQKRASGLWNSENAFYLVGGSTSGILAGIYACTKRGGKILIARNCHKSVYHAIELCGLVPYYINQPVIHPYGFCCSVSPDSIKETLLQEPDIQLVVITSPTYEGILSDISAIACIVHKHGIPLLVDEAHGAHLGLSDEFPQNAIASGSDIVINSLHKTLPSLTQTALCHIQGNLVSKKSIQHALSLFQTSSPSYLLMASIDSCVNLLHKSGKELMHQWKMRLEEFYNSTSTLDYLEVIRPESTIPGIYSHDPSKLLMSTIGTQYTGGKLVEHLLKTYKIQLEMATVGYSIAMTSPCDTSIGFRRLSAALCETDHLCISTRSPAIFTEHYPYCRQIMIPSAAVEAQWELLSLNNCPGRISSEYVWAYPPGIPIITPGQEITINLIDLISQLISNEVSLFSTSGKLPEQIRVITNELF